ncbi:type VII secretion-associated serine protease mycosin, partial [Micromonospora endophytica]
MRVLTRPVAALALTTVSVLTAMSLTATPASADSIRDDSWHLKALDLAEVHKTSQGEGVVVAVVDSGVNADHPDLRGNVLPGIDFAVEENKGRVDREDGGGHGTGVASLIAGHGHGPGNRDGVLGVAPKAKILPVTVRNQKGTLNSLSLMAAGVNWAIDNGADVINVSISGSFSHELNRAVERAYEQGIIVVGAVGNRKEGSIGHPARHDNAIAVNGTDRKGVISDVAALPAVEVDITAPGEDILVAGRNGDYRIATGNSASAALVSGALALIKAKYPDLNAEQLFQRLLETTQDKGDPGHDDYYGWGALDIGQALTGEPDGRTAPTASAAPEPTERQSWQEPRDRDDGMLLFVWAGIIALLVLLVGAIVLLLRARSRRARLATGNPPLPVGSPTGHAVTPQPLPT